MKQRESVLGIQKMYVGKKDIHGSSAVHNSYGSMICIRYKSIISASFRTSGPQRQTGGKRHPFVSFRQ